MLHFSAHHAEAETGAVVALSVRQQRGSVSSAQSIWSTLTCGCDEATPSAAGWGPEASTTTGWIAPRAWWRPLPAPCSPPYGGSSICAQKA